MRLSEAIRLGSLLVKEPEMGVVSKCAIGMAMRAVGEEVSDDPAASLEENVYKRFGKRWHWLYGREVICPYCQDRPWYRSVLLRGEIIIWHLFDTHVMTDRKMTIEQLADFVAKYEPPEKSLPTQSTGGYSEAAQGVPVGERS